MNRYRQLTSGERYALSALRKQGCNQAAIGRALGRHRSTISREVRRNSKDRQGRAYRPDLADGYARWRRGRSRRNERFGACDFGNRFMVVEVGPEHPELVVADDPPVALLGLHERGRSPAQGHRSVLPVGHPAGLLSYARVGAVDSASGVL